MKIATYQRQRHQRAPAAPARMARARIARRRVPAGAQGAGRELSRAGDPRRRLRRDLARAALVERRRDPREAASEPVEIRRGLPGDPDDTHSRYIEAAVGGIVVGCLYLPNGNPQPGPKFDYKLAVVRAPDRARADAVSTSEQPVVLRRRLQRRADRLRHLQPASRGRRTRCCSRRAARCVSAAARARLDRCAAHAASGRARSTRSGITSATTGSATRACASITCC